MASERLTFPSMTSDKTCPTMGDSLRRSFPIVSDGTFASFLLHLDDVAPSPARTAAARDCDVRETEGHRWLAPADFAAAITSELDASVQATATPVSPPGVAAAPTPVAAPAAVVPVASAPVANGAQAVRESARAGSG